MSANFEISLALTGQAAGRYSNRQADRGGETYKDISRVKQPNWPGWLIIDSLKGSPDFKQKLETNEQLRIQVRAFYYLLWDRMNCNLTDCQELANTLFDTATLMGESRATEFLQTALNAVNWSDDETKDNRLWPDLKVDGVFGSKTRVTLMMAKQYHEILEGIITNQRGTLCIEIIEHDPPQEENARGWFARINRKKGCDHGR